MKFDGERFGSKDEVVVLTIAAVAILSLIPIGASVRAATSPGSAATAATFTNPIASNRSDPHIILSAGRYYLTSTDGCVAGSICVWESATLTGLGSATRHAVWKIPACPAPNCGDVWAPEIHQIGGRFYIYYTFHLANRAGNQQCSSTI